MIFELHPKQRMGVQVSKGRKGRQFFLFNGEQLPHFRSLLFSGPAHWGLNLSLAMATMSRENSTACARGKKRSRWQLSEKTNRPNPPWIGLNRDIAVPESTWLK
jgi:hypothetical protein